MTPIIYHKTWIENPDKYLEAFKALDWEQRDAPRAEYYCNDYQEPYIYGKGKGQREYLPRPWTLEITDIRNKLESLTGFKFEVCFLNRYLNQSNHLGWHADDSPEMDDNRPIGIVSFGVEREIWFRANGEKDIDKIVLHHGSLCLMQPGMQDNYQHRIPKASFQCGERISMTFRGYVNGQ